MSTAVFPTLAGLAYPVVRSPIFSSLVQTSVSGKENRVALWSYPRWKWTLQFNFLRDDANNDFRTLLGFWLQRKGQFDSFLYTDADDNSVTGQAIGTGDGATASFQLVRTLGGFDEPVLAPQLPTAIYVDGVSVSGWNVTGWGNTYLIGGSASTDGPGVLLFNAGHIPASGKAITADFSYYWPVRFTGDSADYSKFMNKLWELQTLEFESVKS